MKQLLSKTDLVGLVQKYVPLTKKGAGHWGCCPFHHEKTPSFQVNEVKQLYYCFGCTAGGNAITFLSKIESIEKTDAIKLLAEKAGLELPETEYKAKTDTEQLKKKKKRLLELLKDCAKHYHENLLKPEAELATAYLNRRKLDNSMVKRFGLGYSLGFNEAIDFLKSKGYTLEEMRDAGIASQRADRHYDVFAKRLIVPIIDAMGNVTGFGGRILDNSDFAKYRNSSQTLVFDKSKSLFAINLVKKVKQKEGLKHLIIAEGYMDVIALSKAGFNAVASMGTALTIDQAKMIRNFTSSVYISYDGDSAGQKATLRGLDILADAGLAVKIISMPEGLDPDDVINQMGRNFYQELMGNALPLTTFKLESLKKDFDMDSPEGKSNYAVEAVKIIKKFSDPVKREEYLKQVQKNTGYSMQVLYKQAEFAPEEVPEYVPQPQHTLQFIAKASKSVVEAKEFVLSQIAAQKAYADLNEQIYTLLDDEELQQIFTQIMEARKNSDYRPDSLSLIEDFEDNEMLKRIASYVEIEGDNVQKYNDCIRLLKINFIEKQINEIKARIKQKDDPELMQKLNELILEQAEIKKR